VQRKVSQVVAQPLGALGELPALFVEQVGRHPALAISDRPADQQGAESSSWHPRIAWLAAVCSAAGTSM
jgi:hypothetical protein